MINWQIIDDDGVIHSGTEEEMNIAYNVMTNQLSEDLSVSQIRVLQHTWDCEWKGDLKLVQIHNITR